MIVRSFRLFQKAKDVMIAYCIARMIMIEVDDAIKVVNTVAENLMGVAMNKSNFERLPDRYWGYFARGHDSKGKFGVIIAYSEDSDDIVQLIEMYQQWAVKNKTK